MEPTFTRPKCPSYFGTFDIIKLWASRPLSLTQHIDMRLLVIVGDGCERLLQCRARMDSIQR
jgi:hypothetical protein